MRIWWDMEIDFRRKHLTNIWMDAETKNSRRYLGGGSVRNEPLPMPVKREDKAVQEANADALRRRMMAKGYKSTILASMRESGLRTSLGS